MFNIFKKSKNNIITKKVLKANKNYNIFITKHMINNKFFSGYKVYYLHKNILNELKFPTCGYSQMFKCYRRRNDISIENWPIIILKDIFYELKLNNIKYINFRII
jgi:hypothetical protein